MNRDRVRCSTRLSGQVARYHTWPTITQQSVGEHTWQLVRIYIEIFGPPGPGTTVYMIYHDSPEIITGDPPFPIKKDNPELATIYHRLDEEAMLRLTGHGVPPITREEAVRVKVCDLLEMHEFGKHELMLGNKYAAPIIADTWSTVMSMIDTVAVPGRDADLIRQYMEKRR